jgi:hypothetical protein
MLKQSNSFVEQVSILATATNIGLFFYFIVENEPCLQLLSLFNVVCHLLYFLVLEW